MLENYSVVNEHFIGILLLPRSRWAEEQICQRRQGNAGSVALSKPNAPTIPL